MGKGTTNSLQRNKVQIDKIAQFYTYLIVQVDSTYIQTLVNLPQEVHCIKYRMENQN